MRYWDLVVSVDLGQRHDYTAIAVGAPLRWCQPATPVIRPGVHGVDIDPLEGVAQRHGVGWLSPLDLTRYEIDLLDQVAGWRPPPSRPPIAVPHLERVRGESYVRVVDRVEHLLRALPGHLEPCLVVDAGGVGRSVVDLMSERGLRPACVTATGGDQVAGDWGDVRVPKRELVTAAQVALSAGLLRIAADLPLAQALVDELVNYQVTISAAGHDSYEARSGAHDDLVYAVTQMVWAFTWYHAYILAADAAAR